MCWDQLCLFTYHTPLPMRLPAARDALAPGTFCCFPVMSYYFFQGLWVLVLGLCVCVRIFLAQSGLSYSEVCGIGREGIVFSFGLRPAAKWLQMHWPWLHSWFPPVLSLSPATDQKRNKNYLQFYKKETWSSKTSLKYTFNKTWYVYFSELSFENCPLNYCSEK